MSGRRHTCENSDDRMVFKRNFQIQNTEISLNKGEGMNCINIENLTVQNCIIDQNGIGAVIRSCELVFFNRNNVTTNDNYGIKLTSSQNSCHISDLSETQKVESYQIPPSV